MAVTIQLFARARELAAAGAVTLELPAGASVADLRRALTERIPALAGILALSRIAVNHAFVDETRLLASGDEIAVIPPVSGG